MEITTTNEIGRYSNLSTACYNKPWADWPSVFPPDQNVVRGLPLTGKGAWSYGAVGVSVSEHAADGDDESVTPTKHPEHS